MAKRTLVLLDAMQVKLDAAVRRDATDMLKAHEDIHAVVSFLVKAKRAIKHVQQADCEIHGWTPKQQ